MFFSGDTGYSRRHCTEIGSRFSNFDLALIPIGAYEPRRFMRQQHVNPEQAVRIHRHLGSRLSAGIHWGTFQLTDEPLDRRVADLAAARGSLGVGEREFDTPRHGQTLHVDAAGRP